MGWGRRDVRSQQKGGERIQREGGSWERKEKGEGRESREMSKR